MAEPSGAAAPGERIVVGRIVKVFGIQGEVSVQPTGDDPSRFAVGARVFLDAVGGPALSVAASRPHQGFQLVRFDGVPDRTTAEDLAGRVLYCDASDLPRLEPGVFYHFQLVGMTARTTEGRVLGTLERVVDFGGGDLYEVHGPEGQYLIPARKEFVERIDAEAREIVLVDRADLLQAQHDEKTGPKRRPRREGLRERRLAMRNRYGKRDDDAPAGE